MRCNCRPCTSADPLVRTLPHTPTHLHACAPTRRTSREFYFVDNNSIGGSFTFYMTSLLYVLNYTVTQTAAVGSGARAWPHTAAAFHQAAQTESPKR